MTISDIILCIMIWFAYFCIRLIWIEIVSIFFIRSQKLSWQNDLKIYSKTFRIMDNLKNTWKFTRNIVVFAWKSGAVFVPSIEFILIASAKSSRHLYFEVIAKIKISDKKHSEMVSSLVNIFVYEIVQNVFFMKK